MKEVLKHKQRKRKIKELKKKNLRNLRKRLKGKNVNEWTKRFMVRSWIVNFRDTKTKTQTQLLKILMRYKYHPLKEWHANVFLRAKHIAVSIISF